METIGYFAAALVLQGGGAVDIRVSKRHRRCIGYSLPNDPTGSRLFLPFDAKEEVCTKQLEQHINEIFKSTSALH